MELCCVSVASPLAESLDPAPEEAAESWVRVGVLLLDPIASSTAEPLGPAGEVATGS